MNQLMLNAFYDTVNEHIGPVLAWTFGLLLTIELIYVMFKYLGSEDKK
ncbi:MAG: hypothetical protein JNL72_04465 [Flavipsychrobacter sp.]|nr:hypothetical protein [Flavipsychrobacter sp.]